MLQENSSINTTGTVMVNFFLKPLEKDTTLNKLEIIFPEDRIADVVKIKPLCLIRFWNGQKLFLDGSLNNLSTTHKVGTFEIVFPSEFCGQGGCFWLSLNFPVAPVISKALPVSVRTS